MDTFDFLFSSSPSTLTLVSFKSFFLKRLISILVNYSCLEPSNGLRNCRFFSWRIKVLWPIFKLLKRIFFRSLTQSKDVLVYFFCERLFFLIWILCRKDGSLKNWEYLNGRSRGWEWGLSKQLMNSKKIFVTQSSMKFLATPLFKDFMAIIIWQSSRWNAFWQNWQSVNGFCCFRPKLFALSLFLQQRSHSHGKDNMNLFTSWFIALFLLTKWNLFTLFPSIDISLVSI